jgi:hypothetical protein
MAAVLTLDPRGGHPDFLDLPWSDALEEWDSPRLVRMARGISRHVVRFVQYGERVYALKETSPALARGEYRMLRELAADGLPVVEAVGVVTDRRKAGHEELGAVLITRYLDYSLPYRYLFGLNDGPEMWAKLIDAGVLLLVRLHLEGVYWGDCSLSNVLFRRDAGALMAYLVDAETAERHDPPLVPGMRGHDLEIAIENIAAGLADLQAAGRIREEVDPIRAVTVLEERYQDLWAELTAADEVGTDERHRIDDRIRRLNELGFDVEELVLEATDEGGHRLRIQPVLVEEGHHHRELRRLTGLDVQENQARRLLNDITSYRSWIERTSGRPVPEAVAAARWLAEIYEPVVSAVPPELAPKREPAELFHEFLEHRWFLSEQAGREVLNDEALADYLATQLAERPSERTVLDALSDIRSRDRGPGPAPPGS